MDSYRGRLEWGRVDKFNAIGEERRRLDIATSANEVGTLRVGEHSLSTFERLACYTRVHTMARESADNQ